MTIYQPDGENNLKSIYFIDNLVGFAAGHSGGIVKTIDGGVSWTQQHSGIEVPLFSIFFIDKKLGFIVGGNSGCNGSGCIPIGGVILRTENGGEIWDNLELKISEKIELKSIQFIDENTGFAVGGSVILKTIDGGITWAETKIENLNGTLQEISMMGLNGMIVCSGGQIVLTQDGGISWEISSNLSLIGSVSISLLDDNNAIVSGNGILYSTKNFGKLWQEVKNPPLDNFDVNFVSDKFGLAVGRGAYSGGDFGYNYGSDTFDIFI